MRPRAAGRLAELLAGYRKISGRECMGSNRAKRLGRFSLSRARRLERFERDYPALLLSLASAVRTGLDPLVAVMRSQALFPAGSPLHEELGKFKGSLESGISEEQAIAEFAADLNHPDIKLFRSALFLARREGGSLADSLQRLAAVSRQRQSFRRKVRAALAMQRLSAFGIAGCALLVGIIQASTNPEAMKLTMAHPAGSRLLMLGVALISFGIAWMTRTGRLKV